MAGSWEAMIEAELAELDASFRRRADAAWAEPDEDES